MRHELAAVSDQPQVQLCAFMVGLEEYAIDIHRVLEILHPPVTAEFPRAPGLDGVINLRGEIVPLVDLRRVLGASSELDAFKQKLLICLLGRRKIAFRVDRVTQVVRTSHDELKPLPPLSDPARSPYVIGVCSRGARLLLLLNLRAVVEA